MSPALLVLQSPPGEPAWNMALDEALLVTAGERGVPLLRFYGWTEPAATFGYFQHHADVARLTLLRPLIRRPTGGGIVPHDRDWTYSLIIPPAHPWHRLAARLSYRQMHAWVAAAFAAEGVDVELADAARRELPGQCFAGWEEADILWQGRKVGGAAQRRNRLGLLIQGSVQPPAGANRDRWEAGMRHHLPPMLLPGPVVDWTPAPHLTALARHLADTRYSLDAHTAAR